MRAHPPAAAVNEMVHAITDIPVVGPRASVAGQVRAAGALRGLACWIAGPITRRRMCAGPWGGRLWDERSSIERVTESTVTDVISMGAASKRIAISARSDILD
jgi:hypothetical protein